MKRLNGLSFLACLAVTAVTAAQEENVIYQHNLALQEGTHYAIVQAQKRITILLGVEGETFELEARTEELVGQQWVDRGPGDINLIIANENAGEFTLTVERRPGRWYGARNVKQIDLSADGVTGRIGDMHLQQDLGELGPVVADAIVGDWMIIDGIIRNDVVVNSLDGDLRCASFFADLTVNGPGPHAGRIFIFVGDYSHSMFINGSSSGLIELWGDLAGRIQIATDNRGICLIWRGGRTRRMYMGVPTGRRA